MITLQTALISVADRNCDASDRQLQIAGRISAKTPNVHWSFEPTRKEQQWGLWVPTFGSVEYAPGSCYPHAGHPKPYQFSFEKGRVLSEFVVVYISSGSGWFESKDIPRRRLEAGNVFVLFPGVWHRCTADERTGWHEHWVALRGPRADLLFKKGFLSRKHTILEAADGPHELLPAFRMMHEIAQNQADSIQPRLASLAEYLVGQCYNYRQSTRTAVEPDRIVAQVIQRMRERPEKDVDMEKLAVELNVSYRWLRRSFAQHTGMGPHQYAVGLRVELARELLLNSDLSIKEVARRTGFVDEHYFSRAFRLRSHVSPRVWREKALAEKSAKR